MSEKLNKEDSRLLVTRFERCLVSLDEKNLDVLDKQSFLIGLLCGALEDICDFEYNFLAEYHKHI